MKQKVAQERMIDPGSAGCYSEKGLNVSRRIIDVAPTTDATGLHIIERRYSL